MGDVGAVATLLNTVVSWFVDPTGYEQMALDHKLAKIREAIDVAIDTKAWTAVDLLMGEYRKLHGHTGL